MLSLITISRLPAILMAIVIILVPYSLYGQLQKCRIGAMRGSHPAILCSAVDRLKQQVETEQIVQSSKPIKNLILLHGPPGNGKTTYAKEIMEETKSHFLELSGTRIVEIYVGNGPKNIANLFKQAFEFAKKGENVVVFIDEIEHLADATTSEHRKEHQLTTADLWQTLDQCKSKRNILVICATNNITRMHPTLKDRFKGSIIEVGNPKQEQSMDIISSYYANYFPDVPNERLLNKILEPLYEPLKKQIIDSYNVLHVCVNSFEKVAQPLAVKIVYHRNITALNEFKKTIEELSTQKSDKVIADASNTIKLYHSLGKVFSSMREALCQIPDGDEKTVFQNVLNGFEQLPINGLAEGIKVWDSIGQINKSIKRFDKRSDDKKNITDIIGSLKTTVAELPGKNNDQDFKQLINFANVYCNSIERYINENTAKPESFVNDLSKKTEGLSVRGLLRILEVVNDNPGKDLTKEIEAEKLVDILKKEEQDKAKKEEEEGALRKLQIQDLKRKTNENFIKVENGLRDLQTADVAARVKSDKQADYWFSKTETGRSH